MIIIPTVICDLERDTKCMETKIGNGKSGEEWRLSRPKHC